MRLEVKISQLCPKCKTLFVVDAPPFRSHRDLKREIDCPKCVSEMPGAKLLEKFSNGR